MQRFTILTQRRRNRHIHTVNKSYGLITYKKPK